MICQKPGQITLAIEIRHRICVLWLQERAHMTVPKGMDSGDAGLPLVELKFSVFQSGRLQEKKMGTCFLTSRFPTTTTHDIFRHSRFFRATFLEVVIYEKEIRQTVHKNKSFI